MTSLLHKPDWPETRQRYEAWWRGDRMDRPMLWVSAPRDNLPAEPWPKAPDDLEQRWTDLDYLAAVNDYQMRRTYYAAESLPVWCPGYPGHATIPTYYGCPFKLAESTGWHDPILPEETLDISGLKIDKTCRWYQWGETMFARARRESAGKCLPSTGAIFGLGDTLGLLRGNYRLLLDLIDQPEAVRDAELKMMDDWFDVYQHQVDLLTADGGDFATWFPIWAPGRHYAVQCDVSYGISPGQYRECFLPALKKWTQWLDHSIYHLDGVGAFHLVEEIAKADRIRAIQVLPGSGKPSPLHYMDTLKTVQRLGLGLYIMIAPEEVPQALATLSSRGLFLFTWARDQKHADELLATTARLAVDRG